MVNNCVSSCAPSIAMSHTSFKCPELCPEPHLSLRNKIYYCRMELPATNGKRNVLRFSLSTDNYYEASQMIKDIKQYLKNISRLDQLYKRLTLEKIYTNTNDSTNSSYIYVLSKDNDVELLKNIKSLYDDCMTNDLDDDLEDYIQPFEDGNKRTSRILGNALLLANDYCPLSYRSVDEVEYKKGVILFYEQNNASYFKKLFLEQFEQAVKKYFE